jgi:hypothetical protein
VRLSLSYRGRVPRARFTFSITSSATCWRGGDDGREPPCSMLRAAPKKRFGPCAQWRGEDVSAGVGSGMGGRGGWSVRDAVPTVDGWDGPDAAAGCLGVSAWTSLGTFFRGGTGTGAAWIRGNDQTVMVLPFALGS